MHLERSDQPDQLSAAVAQADDAERPARDLAAQHLGLAVPAALPGDPVLLEQPLGQSQHEEERRRRGRVIQRQRGVEDGHAVLGAGSQVDLVVARARTADHEQVARARGERALLHPGPKHDQPVDVLDVLGPTSSE